MARLELRGRTYHAVYWDAARQDWIRRTTRCRDKRAAERVAARFERDAADPAHTAATQTSIATVVRDFLADRKARDRAEATLSFYESKLGHVLRIFGDDTPAAMIDAPSIDRYIETRQAEGASNHTLSKELRAFGGVLRLARRRGTYPRDPAEVMPVRWDTGYTPRTTAHTRAQADALLGVLPAHRAAHVAFLVATGARWAESVRAQIEDVQPNIVAPELVVLRGTKTKRAARAAPIPSDLRAWLGRRLTACPPPFRRWTLPVRDLAAACKRAGVPRVTPNDLRRTLATWLRGAGVDTSLVAAHLGHVDSRMVERVYGRLAGAELGAAIDARLRVDEATRAAANAALESGLVRHAKGCAKEPCTCPVAQLQALAAGAPVELGSVTKQTFSTEHANSGRAKKR